MYYKPWGPIASGDLGDHFGVPPFSVLDARSGYWQARKAKWKALGFSNDGRFHVKCFGKGLGVEESMDTSIFDPVTCELLLGWFSKQSDLVLDPFAGGAVRGTISAMMNRDYIGVDIRQEQVDANRLMAERLQVSPTWIVGDSKQVIPSLSQDFDFLMSCPPYGDLEIYSDDPCDLSAMDKREFSKVYTEIVSSSVSKLNRDRFAAFVVSDYRIGDCYCDFVGLTIRSFVESGCGLYNRMIVARAVGSASMRAKLCFRNRKVVPTHDEILVFVKGDPIRAAARLEQIEQKAKTEDRQLALFA